MGTHLAVRAALVLSLLVSGCAAQPETGVPAPAPAYNSTDVMYLQMSLAQIGEGDQVAELASRRATDARVRTIAAELREQWRAETVTIQDWLLGWQQPLTASGSHEGHGALHMLRPSDIDELRSASGPAFDRTAVSLLLGHLGNCVETARMEVTGGGYAPAKGLAATVTERRQSQVRRLLTLAAG